MKLYLVEIRTYGALQFNYVIAKTPDQAYQKVRDFLEKKDWCFSKERELKSVTLIAEESEYPKCETHLFT